MVCNIGKLAVSHGKIESTSNPAAHLVKPVKAVSLGKIESTSNPTARAWRTSPAVSHGKIESTSNKFWRKTDSVEL